jgi:hypothetical protein
MTDELLEDLIKTNLLNILQWISIDDGGGVQPLTPYQAETRRLAQKYQVPSPTERAVAANFLPPPVPEGKVRNE